MWFRIDFHKGKTNPAAVHVIAAECRWLAVMPQIFAMNEPCAVNRCWISNAYLALMSGVSTSFIGLLIHSNEKKSSNP